MIGIGVYLGAALKNMRQTPVKKKKRKGWWITLLENEPSPKARIEFVESPLNKMDAKWRKELNAMPFWKLIKMFNKQQRDKQCIQILAEMNKLPTCIDRSKVIDFFCKTYGLDNQKFRQWYFGKPVKLGLISRVKVILREKNG